MSRFLRRAAKNEQPAVETSTPVRTTEPPAQTTSAPPPLAEPPRKAPTRRGSRGRGGRGRGGAAGSAAPSEAGPPSRTGQPNQSNQSNQAPQSSQSSPPGQPNRGGPRRTRQEPARSASSDPADQTLALLERQTALLEQQGEAIQQLAASQQLLTRTLLGQRGDDSVPARIEVLPRLAIFVDVPNILYGAEASGVRLNWGKVADFLSHGRTLVRAIAYAPISDDPSARTENERFVVPFLDHGYRIATKQLKRFSGGSVKANFDVELAIDVLTMSDRVDVIVLVSGDGDFRRLVEIVGARGVRVEVMAFGKSTSSDLRQVADRYIDIAQYADQLRD